MGEGANKAKSEGDVEEEAEEQLFGGEDESEGDKSLAPIDIVLIEVKRNWAKGGRKSNLTLDKFTRQAAR